MSTPTTPAHVVYINDSDESFRALPVFDFLFDHKDAFDRGDMKTLPYTRYHTDDFVFTKGDGTVLPAGEASWQAFQAGYAPFTEYRNEPRYCCAYERDGGWEVIGLANVFANLPVPGDKTKADMSGRKWDVMIQGALRFNCVADPNGPKGYKLKSITLYGDSMPVVSEMVKRGMIKPEELAA